MTEAIAAAEARGFRNGVAAAARLLEQLAAGSEARNQVFEADLPGLYRSLAEAIASLEPDAPTPNADTRT
jgi:hypothetical protein